MRTVDILSSALRNAFRSRLRTTLTVLAVFVGALTLSLTNGLGTGINAYVQDTVASVGVEDVMTVTKTDQEAETGDGPQPYDPDQLQATGDGPGGGAPGAPTTIALTDDDITTIRDVEGVLRVEPARNVAVDYVQHDDGDRYQLSLSQLVPGMHVELASGSEVDLEADTPQVVLPDSYLQPLGLGSTTEAVGQEVTFAVTDATGKQTTTTAEVTGIAEPGLVAMLGGVPNEALITTLHDLQTTGAPANQEDTYASASVWFDLNAQDGAATLKDGLEDAGYTATTLEDQLGAITSVVDTIVLVLNGFAIIALLAASIGIVNTLFMAVQERTREIGLMKAMGLSSAKVFSLFSMEATIIGLLGSGLGVLGAIGIGQAVSGALSGSLLADLPGLTLVAFDPLSVAVIVLGVMAVAFLAGTTPALRAAQADPIASLRYE